MNNDTEEKCEHVWKFISDWMGNPDVPNGTMDVSFWQCRNCGEESYDTPDEVDEGY